MKTVKEVSEIAGISIRTLRYYDEIGLLKPTEISDAGYRLYDSKALEKLQEIMFFRELEIPLTLIKELTENPSYDREQTLLTQKKLLERKRNRLNGIIELISDVMKGFNTMSFKAFNNEDISKIWNHFIELQNEGSIQLMTEKYGSVEAFRSSFEENIKGQSARLIKIYGSKEKAVQASLSTTTLAEKEKLQEENNKIFRQFAKAKETDDEALAMDAVKKYADTTKRMFGLDNARTLLLEIADGYLQCRHPEINEHTDKIYGNGVTEYIGHAIKRYYGAE